MSSPTPVATTNCSTCKFGLPAAHPANSVLCMRYPPEQYSGTQATFPNFPSSIWCGEFVAGPPPPVNTDFIAGAKRGGK